MSDPIGPVVRLELLHEHYKESYALIRERERQRDRLLLIIIGLFAVLIFAVGYHSQFSGSLGSFSLLGIEIKADAIPAAALLSALWVFTAVIVLRYCQLCVGIERNYAYLHPLEEKIGTLLGDKKYFCREGFAYLEKYPPLLDFAWMVYGYAVPLILGMAAIALALFEVFILPLPWFHKALDFVIALSVVFTLVSYRAFPTLQRRNERVRDWFKARQWRPQKAK